MASKRLRRLEKRIQQIVSEHILHHLSDPRIGFVTITKTELLSDLSRVTIYVSVLGKETDINRTMSALKSAAGFLQRTVGGALSTRTVPHLVFEYDNSIEKSFEMERLIRVARESDTDGGRETADSHRPPRGTKMAWEEMENGAEAETPSDTASENNSI